jgi:CP family cyanate transporter-like MFS transporter
MKKSANKYVIESLLFASYMFFGMSWTATSAFIPTIMEQMGINSLAAGSWITNAVSLSKIVGTFIAASVMAKYGARKAVMIAMALMTLGVFTGMAPNYVILLLIRFLVGLGGALIVVFFAPLVFELFKPTERPLINGLNSVALNTGAALVTFTLASVMIFFDHSWQTVILVISMGTVITLVLWIIFGTDTVAATPATATTGSKYGLKDGLKDKFNWLFAFTYCGTLSFYIILLTFYQNAGIAQSKWFLLLGIIGTAVGIIVARRTKQRLPLMRISGLIQLIAIVGVHSRSWGLVSSPTVVLISSIVAGFFIFLPMTNLILFAQERKEASPQNLGVTFSLFWSISYVVATFAPFVFGLLFDMTNKNYQIPFVFSTIMASTFLIGSLLLKEEKKA